MQDTLDFTCTCQNGSAPGLEYYSQSMPSFICQQAFQECIDTNVGNKLGQDNCTTGIQNNCGKLDAASAVPTTASSTTASATGAPTGATESSAPATTSSKAAAPTNAYYYGNGAAVVAIGLFAYLV